MFQTKYVLALKETWRGKGTDERQIRESQNRCVLRLKETWRGKGTDEGVRRVTKRER